MSRTLTVNEFARRLSDYIDRVVHLGETFVLVRGKKPIAEIRLLPVGRRLSELPQLMANLPHLSREDADAFAADIDSMRAELNLLPRRMVEDWRSAR